MLFIHGAFRLGGIETFYLRIARYRYGIGLKTSFFFTSERKRSDDQLVDELSAIANVFFLDDLLPKGFGLLRLFRAPISIFTPFSKEKVRSLFNGVSCIHSSDAFGAIVGCELSNKIAIKLPVTIGVYHEGQFTWTGNQPYFERVNRRFIYNIMPKRNILTFNERMVQRMFDKGFNVDGARYFPLGVVDSPEPKMDYRRDSKFKIVSVGRLVDFKTYNLWMIEVCSKLASRGYSIEYDIYGEGPLKPEINGLITKFNLEGIVRLRGNLDYANFREIKEYDLFIGSGTSIVEAASLGVPSLVGIESIETPQSYNFFSRLSGTTYNESGLHQLFSIEALIQELIEMDFELIEELRWEHVNKSKLYSIETCSSNMCEFVGEAKLFQFSFPFLSKVIYAVSYGVELTLMRITNSRPFSNKYVSK